jgi:DNA-3-methyladenine glycosylase II
MTLTPYFKHLQKDKKLELVLSKQQPIVLKQEKDYVAYLCSSIIGQQLSTKVAAVIRNRFFSLIVAEKNLAEQIMGLDIDAMRSIGLSQSKAGYMKNLASFSIEHHDQISSLSSMLDKEIIKFLTQIKGIGAWTVEMLLMFAMQREDVFPVDDLGIQQAMIKLYEIEASSKKELKLKMNQIAASWSPYRTYASMHLWRWKDS